MELGLGFLPCDDSVFYSFEGADAKTASASSSNLNVKFPGSFLRIHPSVAALSPRYSDVSQVVGSAAFSEVVKPIVAFTPIDVVNIKFRPFARHVEPCEPVFEINGSVYIDLTVPTFSTRASTVTNAGASSSSDEANKFAGLFVVREDGFKVSMSDHARSHANRYVSCQEG